MKPHILLGEAPTEPQSGYKLVATVKVKFTSSMIVLQYEMSRTVFMDSSVLT